MRESFVFYGSYFEAITELDETMQVHLFKAICEYALYDKLPDISGTEKAFFALIKPTLDANNQRYVNGKKGGRPAKSKTKKPMDIENIENQKPTVIENIENQKPNENDNVNENDNDNVNEKEIEPNKPALSQPSINQVETVVGLYHEICKSYPKIKSISEARRKAVRARLRTYGLGEFRTVFSKAEESDFLKGKNERNWSATFDWIIKDSSFTKILDGNYDNKSHSGYSSKNSSDVDKYKCVINQFDFPGGME